MKKKKSIILTMLPAVLTLLFLAGCGPGELEVAHTISGEDYQIEILASEGEFKEGEIPLSIRITRDGEIVELSEGRLDLHMPEMGAMPRMDTGTNFTKSGSGLQGEIFFEMDGGWQGTIEVTTADGEKINESIRIRVQ